jgi:hypothetical protein
VRAAVDVLADQWGTLLPFLDRIHGGEDLETVAVAALAAFNASPSSAASAAPVPTCGR